MKRIVIDDSDKKIHVNDIGKSKQEEPEMISFHPSELAKTHYYEYHGPLVVGKIKENK